MVRTTMRPTRTLVEHALIALIPPASERDFQALRADIARYGIRQPLSITRGGAVLDGRHRLRAARDLGLRTVPIQIVSAEDEKDPETFILRSSLLQKQLSDDQRAVLAYEYLLRRRPGNRRRACATARMAKALKRDGKSMSATAPQTDGANSWNEARHLFRVAERKIRWIKRLQKLDPSLVDRIRCGEIGILEAKRLYRIGQIKLQQRSRMRVAGRLRAINELIHGDCLTMIPSLPDDMFRLLCTDPPWGCRYRQSWRVASPREDILNDDENTSLRLFDRMLRVVQPKMQLEHRLLIFVPWRHEPAYRAVIEGHGYRIRHVLTWVRAHGTFAAGSVFANQATPILYAVKGDAKIHRRRSDVFHAARQRETDHPCENPVTLLAQLLECATLPGEAVLDPFAGSGSCIEAAWSLGRRAVGIELHRRYYLDALARLRAVKPRDA